MIPCRRRRAPLLVIAAMVALSAVQCARPALRRFPDRPVLWQDDDRRPLKRAPAFTSRGRWAAVLATGLTDPLERLLAAGRPAPAKNVNAWGEVPSSSWFENRNHRRLRTPAQLRRGAARTAGPSLLSPWTVRWAAPTARGLRVAITDDEQQRFLLSFDAPGHPRLATTAELVATLLLHALGYRVPARHLVLVERAQLRVTQGSRLRRADGRTEAGALKRPALARLLSALPRLTDGSLRAVATRQDGSQDLGPFRFDGRRADDPNDYVDHDRRRELRGLLPVAAWLNLTTISRGVGRDRFRGRRPRYVVHRLEGLRGALGSTPAGTPKPLEDGFREGLAPGAMLRQILTFGATAPPWRHLRKLRQHQRRRWPGLGWLPSKAFRPRHFRPHLWNTAFARADARDRFWAGRLLASLTGAQLRTVIAEALLPKAEAKRLLETLLLRRRRVLRRTLAARAPLDGYEILPAMGRLCFTDLWRREGFDHQHQRLVTYQVRVRDPRGLVPRSARTHEARNHLVCVPLPRCVPGPGDDGYRVLELRRPDVSLSGARVHLRPGPRGPRIAGIER